MVVIISQSVGGIVPIEKEWTFFIADSQRSKDATEVSFWILLRSHYFRYQMKDILFD